jgi:hypothetical protein
MNDTPDPSLHTWDGPQPEARRDKHGALVEPLPATRWPGDDAMPRCGLCGRCGPLAVGRTICANCAHFPLD